MIIKNNWFKCTIGDVVILQQGLCINKKSNHLLSQIGYPLLRITDLINNTQIQYRTSI
jgi:type I restriction enzyme S subunit